MSFTKLLNQVCDIQRFARSQTSTGSIDKTWLTISSHNCRLRKRAIANDGSLATPYSKATHVIYLPKNTDIKDNDRVDISGKIFNIVAVQSDSSIHHLEVLAQSIIQK